MLANALLVLSMAALAPSWPQASRRVCASARVGRTGQLHLLEQDLFDSPLPAELDEDAAALLEEAEGDIEKARQSYIGYTLAYLEEAMPELYRALQTDANLPEPHAALVEVTWDAIAAFMPVTHSSRPTQEAAKRLAAISRVSLPAGGATGATRLLDVGCGNGLLLPFLTEMGLPASAYRGIDVSSRMIALAEHAHGSSGAEFADASFADECASGNRYETVVFNGALQFFEDQPATLKAAAALLSDSEEARIIVSHVSGASFVRKELGDNPTTVKNTMPFLGMMQEIAADLEMQVVLPSFLGTEVEEIEKALERFYLLVFRRRDPDADDDEASEGAGAIELPPELQVDTGIRLS